MTNGTDEHEEELGTSTAPDVFSEGDLDGPMPVDWPEIAELAIAFEGYDYWGSFDKCADVAESVASSYVRDGLLPNPLVELQTALFFEQRRYHHFGYAPDEAEMPYIRALAAAIRKVPRRRAQIEDAQCGRRGQGSPVGRRY